MSNPSASGMNVLIFEGGAAGGLSSLILFRELVDRIRSIGGNFNIDETCQVMAGTGTGALIACMLGLLGMDIENAIRAYSNMIKLVFSDKKIISASGSGTFKARKLEKELKKIVQAATGDESTRIMADTADTQKCQVMVFAMSEHSLTASTPRIFRSYKGPHHQMPNCPIWQAIRASMAHPELFKGIGIDDGILGESLIGGDVGCSNPTRHVLAEISAMHPDKHISSIVCIGAGHARTIRIPPPSLLRQVIPTNVLMAMRDVAIDSEKVAEEMEAQFEGTGVYWRLSVDQGMQGVRVSEWQKRSEVAAHTRAYMQKAGVTARMQSAAQAMVDRRAIVQVRHIGGKAQKISGQQVTGVKRCPVPSALFTGNERYVAQVINCIVGPANERRVCVIYGLGGSGKTQVALKSIERTLERWTDIAYIDATSRDTAESTLKAFALAKNVGETYQDAKRWLEQSVQPWLLVFDNADDPDLDLRSLMPQGTSGSVLVTTRLRMLGQLGQGPGCDCQITQMDRDEALELLAKKAKIPLEEWTTEEKDDGRGLVEDLGCLALAVVHSGAYMWCTKMSISKYRKQCKQQTRNVLERYIRLPANIEEYEKSVYTTWVMSYERLAPRAKEMMMFFAYLHHDRIKEDIFKRAAIHLDRKPILPMTIVDQEALQYVKDFLAGFLDSKQSWDSNKFAAVVDELLSYSLIDYDRVNDGYAVHVLVQDWARTVNPQSLSEAVIPTSHLLALSIDGSNETEAQSYQRGLLLHVSRIADTSSEIDVNNAACFARVYRRNGRWEEEGKLLRSLVEQTKRELGEMHPDTLTSMHDLAQNYWNQGRWDEAEALHVLVFETRREQLGEKHADTLTSMSNLASTYWNQGRWNEAEVLESRVLEVRRRELGERHPDTLNSMGNLASAYMNQSRWDEAEALNVQVLEVMRQELGDRHPDTLITMGNLASTYMNQNRWNEAEALNVQVLKVMKREFGERHPDTLTSMSNLASTYSDQGRWEDAEGLQVQVLHVRRQVLGERHPSTLSSMGNLALTYRNQGRWDEAEALQVKVLDIRRRDLGDTHPSTVSSMNSLACTHRDRKRLDEAR